LRVAGGIQVSEMESAYLNADYFLQMIYINFAENFKVLRFLSGYLYGIKVSEIAGLISSANLYASKYLTGYKFCQERIKFLKLLNIPDICRFKEEGGTNEKTRSIYYYVTAN
jgi:hypothetical protein